MSSSEQNQSFDVFISYYQKSGSDFAENLKSGLNDCRISAFRDVDDIPKSIKEETEEWRSFVDKCLNNSKNFFLIITFGFNTRPEVLRELKIAFDANKQIYFFRHSGVDYKDLVVEINGKQVELSKYEIISFENSNDLLRKALGALYNRVTKEVESYFTKEAKLKIAQESQQYINSDLSMVEILIGSSNPVEEWLIPTQENTFLVSHYDRYVEIIPRRKYFESKNQDYFFLKVDTNGFIHAIIPLHEDKNRLYIDTITREIYKVIIYAMRIYSFKKYSNPTSVLFILRNCGSKTVDFWNNMWHLRPYTFSMDMETEFSYEFDPKLGWGEIGQLFLKIFKDICLEVGCNIIKDATIKERIRKIIGSIDELRTEFNGIVTIPRINPDLLIIE